MEDGDNFGSSIGIYEDSIFISSSQDDDIGENSGSVYIYNKILSNWSQTHKISATEGANGDTFGGSVSLDGNRALIGAKYDGAGSGSAYIFDYSFGKWSKTAKLTANDGSAEDTFGNSVSLHGNRALIGASRADNNGTTDVGSVYIFELSNGIWEQSIKLFASDGNAHDRFGGSVSLSNNRALIGASGTDDNGDISGSAYVFDYNSGNWLQSIKLLANDGNANDYFGSSVSLDGNRALISSPLDSDIGNNSGSVYVFDSINNIWSQTTKLTAGDSNIEDFFGSSVSLNSDRALIGASSDDDNGIDSGSAYIFELFEGDWLQTDKLLPIDGSAGDNFGGSVSLDNNKLLVGAAYDRNGNVSGSAYVFEHIESSWLQSINFIASDGDAGDYFGNSVSISGNIFLIGSFYDDDNGSYSGSAYIFNEEINFKASFE